MAAPNSSPYRRAIRPVNPDSFPQFVDQELRKIEDAFRAIVSRMDGLEARIVALEAP